MLNKYSLIISLFAVATVIAGAIPMVPHSVEAKKHNNNNYSYSSQYTSNSCCSNDGQLNYNNGNNDGWYTAQSDWNNNVYSADSGGNPNQGCTSHHTQQYCNGYYNGYSKLWTQWQYNLAHGLNLVNSPQQGQSSTVSVKGNNNNVTVNQGQASNSGNNDGSSISYGSSYGSSGGGN